jgi:hypothetical protein
MSLGLKGVRDKKNILNLPFKRISFLLMSIKHSLCRIMYVVTFVDINDAYIFYTNIRTCKFGFVIHVK